MMTSGSVPRRAAVLLGLLASASNQTLLAALTVVSLNTALLSSAGSDLCHGRDVDLRQRHKRRQRAAGGDCGDGRNADNGYRFDECDGQSRDVLNQCGSRSGHRNRSNRCDYDHRDRHWYHPWIVQSFLTDHRN